MTATTQQTAQTAAANQTALRDAIAAIRFHDIAALCRKVKGGPLGVDINRKFTAANGPIKLQFADWALATLDNVALAEHLPEFAAVAARYYAARGNKTAAAKQTAQAHSLPVVETLPLPTDAPADTPQPLAADVAAILAAARETAATMDGAQARAIADLNRRLAEVSTTARPIAVTVNNRGKVDTTKLPAQHFRFEFLLRLAAARDKHGNGYNLWMTGPAGSGKTTAAINIAAALKLPFYFTGAIDNEFKLLGFINATGQIVSPAFRKAYEHGGIFLLDEVDGCHPAALLALNAALANGYCDFPDGNIKRHPDCVIIAAANTWGNGATHEYVGRTKLDDASLDRFKMMAWDYDEALETAAGANAAWTKTVQTIRAKVRAAGIKHIVSPRATYDGAELLADGFTEDDVLGLCVRKGLSDEQWNQVKPNRYG